MTVWLDLGLTRGRGHFLNFLGAPMIYTAKSVFLAVNASLRWLNNVSCVAVYSNIYCASLRAVNPPNLLCKEYGKSVARILQSITWLACVSTLINPHTFFCWFCCLLQW
jgi:hypothetical protein